MNNKKGKWTDEETNALLRMRTAGVPYKEIAKQLNRSAHACTQQYSKVKDSLSKNRVRTVGVKVDDRYNPLAESNSNLMNFAKQLIHPPATAPVPSTERNNKSWTRKEDRLLKSMVRENATMRERMVRLKRTEKAIDSRIRTLGKKKTRKPRPAKVDTVSEIDAELLVNFIRGLQEENKQLRAKLESIRDALKNDD